MIITLCGSARFEKEFKEWNERLAMNGHAAFSLAVYPSDKAGDKNWYSPEQKHMLDICHFQKIAKSDAILVLNVGDYIGESTRNEIAFARSLGKQVYWLEETARRNSISAGNPWECLAYGPLVPINS